MRNKIPAILVFLYLLFLSAHLVPVFAGDSKLWGADQWRYYSKATVVTLSIAGLLPIFRLSNAALADIASRAGDRVVRSIFPRLRNRPLHVLSAVAILFWALRQSTHFLGDGYLWAERMKTGTLFSFTRPLSSSIYQVSCLITGAFGFSQAVAPYAAAAAVSIVSGLVFLVFAKKTAWALAEGSAERIFLLLAVLSTGTMTLFFGYVEAYPPVAAGVMAFIYFGVRYLQGREKPLFIVIIFLVSISLHLTLVLLLPSLVAILLLKREERLARKSIYPVFAAVIVLGCAALWVGRRERLFGGFFYDTFLPFVNNRHDARTAYPMLSGRHLFDVLNEILLVCPIAVLCLPGLLGVTRKKSDSDGGVSLFLGSMAGFYLLGYFIFNKVLGAARDWDLFSPLAIPLALCLALSLLSRYRDIPRVLAVFAFFVFALHNGPWIVVNSSKEKSIDRFVSLVKDGCWSTYARAYGYELLGKHYLYGGDARRGVSYFSKALETEPWSTRYKDDLARAFVKSKQLAGGSRTFVGRDSIAARGLSAAGSQYAMGRQYDLAKAMYVGAMEADSTLVEAYVNLAALYSQTERAGDAIAILERCIEVAPKAPTPLMNAALLYEKKGEKERATAYLKKADELTREARK